MRKKWLLIFFAALLLPGCCVLEVHSPVSPWMFAKSSQAASTTPVSDKSIRTAAADKPSTKADNWGS
ncbi:MAG TPA: hypothetical protein VGJ04_08550 [Pirellulales bacterium]